METKRKVRLSMLLSNIRRAISIAWRFERSLTFRYVAISIFNALMPIFIAYVGKEIVDYVVAAMKAPEPKPLEPLFLWVGAELLLLLGSQLSGQGIGYLAQRLRARLALHIDTLIFEKALRLSVTHFEDPTFMDVLERARKESHWRPLEMITHGLTLGRNTVTLIGYAILLAQFSIWAVVALALASLPFLAESRFAAEEYRIKAARTREEREAYYLQQLLTSDFYVKEIKLFSLGPWLLKRHRRLMELFDSQDRRFAFRRGAAVTALGGVSTLVFYSIYSVIVYQAAMAAITLGAMTLYLTVFRQGQGAFESAMSSVARAYEDNLYMKNLFELLAIADDDVVNCAFSATELSIDTSPPSIVFEHVTFTYPDQAKPALDDISFEIRAGETMALVGPNGAGKTTLIKLLAGLYPLQAGTIRIGGDDISAMTRDNLRQRIGVLFQDFVHYHFSAADNIGAGWLPDIDDKAAITDAARRAGALSIVESLPKGLDNQLGRWFGGQELSIGQWQRMALARAFMRKSKLLILDEPTASIDPQGEHELFLQFQELKEQTTAILITHRFGSVKMADRIMVLERGRLVETGTHGELIAQDGLYSTMFNLQASNYIDDLGPKAG